MTRSTLPRDLELAAEAGFLGYKACGYIAIACIASRPDAEYEAVKATYEAASAGIRALAVRETLAEVLHAPSLALSGPQ